MLASIRGSWEGREEEGRVLVWGAEVAGGGVAVVICPAGDGGHGYTGAEDVGDIGFGSGR